MDESTLARFEIKYAVSPDGCWLWTGAVSRNGYASFRYDGKVGYGHRASYSHHVGPIPPGLDLDHLCRTRHCVNPAHLEPVTRRTNLARGIKPGGYNRAKTHCPQGHEYTEANTHKDGLGQRSCRKCAAETLTNSHQGPIRIGWGLLHALGGHLVCN